MNWSENITCYNADCMEIMQRYPDNYFDLAVVDPPYGIKEDGRNHLGRSYKKSGEPVSKIDKRNGAVVVVPPPNYYLGSQYDDKQPEQSFFNELFRVSKRQIIWGCNYLQFSQKTQSSGRIVWDKVNGDCDQSDCEIAWTNLFSSVRQIEYMWCGMLQGKSIKEGRVSQGNNKLKEKRIHPNHKPQKLYDAIYSRWCNKSWKIIDPMTGGASSILSGLRFGFDEIVGIEIDEKHYQAAHKRFKQQTAQLTLL